MHIILSIEIYPVHAKMKFLTPSFHCCPPAMVEMISTFLIPTSLMSSTEQTPHTTERETESVSSYFFPLIPFRKMLKIFLAVL